MTSMIKKSIFSIILFAILFIAKIIPVYAFTPSGQGWFLVSSCSQIQNPITNYSYCIVGPSISVWSGSSWALIGPGSLGPPYGNSSYTLYGPLIGNLTSNILSATAGNTGQVFAGNTSAAPTFQQKTDKFAWSSGIVLTTTSLPMGELPVTVTENLPNNCTGSKGTTAVPAAGDTTFIINKIASTGSVTAIGSVKFALGSYNVTFPTCTATSFSPGDMIELVGPATNDVSLARFGITLQMNAGGL